MKTVSRESRRNLLKKGLVMPLFAFPAMVAAAKAPHEDIISDKPLSAELGSRYSQELYTFVREALADENLCKLIVTELFVKSNLSVGSKSNVPPLETILNDEKVVGVFEGYVSSENRHSVSRKAFAENFRESSLQDFQDKKLKIIDGWLVSSTEAAIIDLLLATAPS